LSPVLQEREQANRKWFKLEMSAKIRTSIEGEKKAIRVRILQTGRT
jgi:hypothetical protein